jgi:hypothetical protein
VLRGDQDAGEVRLAREARESFGLLIKLTR